MGAHAAIPKGSLMRSLLLKGIAVCAAVPLLVTLIGPAASAEEPSEPDTGTTLVDQIVAAASAGSTEPEKLAAEVALPVDGGGSLTFDGAERITATVLFDAAPGDRVLAALAKLAEIDEVFDRFPAATVRVDPTQLGELSAIPGVASAVPAIRPFTGRIAPAQTASLPHAAAAADSCGPILIEADSPLRADSARELFGVDGTGVTIGIISDSFAATTLATSWEEDVASGALPGPGNPCGYTTPVTLLSDGIGGEDEGRAMAQLVHGIAPGATLLFADAGTSDYEMADHVADLANAGADIIVDDISWGLEPAYQLGVLSATIEKVKAEGVAYFTSAGNGTGLGVRGASEGRPISSWSTTAYRPMACPDWLVTGEDDELAALDEYDCMDFDPDPANSVPYDTLTVRESDTDSEVSMRLLGSIGEPMFGITTFHEWRIFRVVAGAETPELVGVAPQLAAQLPSTIGQITVPQGSELRAVLVRTGHDPTAPAPAVRFGFQRGGDEIAERTFLGDGVSDVVGPTTFGHGGDGSAVSVASLDWRDPSVVRDYSALGPSTLLFEPVRDDAAAPAAPLPEPVVPGTPHIAAVDGTQTTFFGQDAGEPGRPEYRFYGTSAAAPHVAAVAALAQSYRPDLSGAELTTRLLASARGSADGGPVNPYTRFGILDEHVFGAGLVDAEALLTALTHEPSAPQRLAARDHTQTSFTLQWDQVSAATTLDLEVELVAVSTAHTAVGTAAPAGAQPVVSTSLDGAATSHKVEGLVPGGVYTVRLAARNPAGVSDPALLEVSTLLEPGPTPPGPTPPEPTPPGPAEPTASGTPLAQSGSSRPWPALYGAGALLIFGIGVSVAALRRRPVTA